MIDEVLLKDANGASVPVFCPGATVKVSPSGASTATDAAINATDYQLVRIVATAAMHIAVAAAPTATDADMYLPAAMVDYLIIPKGCKIAAIGTGDVYITLHAN
ncbi:MAG TPA: hypothetical protein P5031_07495 [Candidatus Syntrophosphaera sp.]|nr:hypothetical protein [Candidatus Syntrophosphaera sp.]